MIQLMIHLIGVCETTHTGHDAENIVVHSKDLVFRYGGSAGRAAIVRGSSSVGDDQLRIIDAGEIARAGRLVLLGLKGKRIDENGR